MPYILLIIHKGFCLYIYIYNILHLCSFVVFAVFMNFFKWELIHIHYSEGYLWSPKEFQDSQISVLDFPDPEFIIKLLQLEIDRPQFHKIVL